MNKELLIKSGIDYDDGVDRFAGKAEIYESLLLKFFMSGSMEKLQTGLQNKNYTDAFYAAHDLKGNSGSLGIKEFCKTISEITEQLRYNQPKDNINELYNQAKKQYDIAKKAVTSEG